MKGFRDPGRVVAAVDGPTPLPAGLRAQMEATVAKLLAAAELVIAELDRRDPDPDLEPSLSGHAYSAANGAPYLEVPHDQDLELDASDLEPSLSTPEGQQQYDADGQPGFSGIDLEDEHDGREPDVDDEHTLGTSENVDQTRPQRGADDLEPSLCGITAAARGARFHDWASYHIAAGADLEDQCEDEGGACEDEGIDSDSEPDDWGWPAPD